VLSHNTVGIPPTTNDIIVRKESVRYNHSSTVSVVVPAPVKQPAVANGSAPIVQRRPPEIPRLPIGRGKYPV